MVDENVDLRFLGRQVQNLQGDVRDLRADHLRLESDVAGLRADLARSQSDTKAGFEILHDRVARLEVEMRSEIRALGVQIEQVNQTMATNLQVILAAIGK